MPTPVRDAHFVAARVLKDKAKNVALIPSPTSTDPLPELGTLATENVALEVASLSRFSGAREKALFFAFLIHLVLLPRLSTQDRARRLEPMNAKFKHQLASNFLPNVFRAMEVTVTSLNTTIDIDVRLFIALVRFLAENSTLSSQDIFGNDVAKVVRDNLSPFSVPISAFSQFAAVFLPALPYLPIENRLGLLPFSNKIFDDELAPIRGLCDDDTAGAHHIDEAEDEGVESDEESNTDEWDTSSEEEEKTSAPKFLPDVPRTGYFDDGTLFHDTRHWHNHKKPLLPKHLGGDAPSGPANAAEWQRKKKLRADQRFMKTLHDQAATLTGASGAALHQIKIPPVGAASNQSPSKVIQFTYYD